MTNIENLFLCIQNENNDQAQSAIKELGVEARDSYGRTPLINAAFYGNTDLMNWLIEQGADTNAQDNEGLSALHFSVQENKLECTQLLLKNNANPDVQDKHGNTPAAVVIVNWKGGENFDNLAALVASGANLDICNNAGKSVSEILPAAIKSKLGI